MGTRVHVSVISSLYLQLSRTEHWQPGWKSLADQEQDVLEEEISCRERSVLNTSFFFSPYWI